VVVAVARAAARAVAKAVVAMVAMAKVMEVREEETC
jgi:hypothetical protein